MPSISLLEFYNEWLREHPNQFQSLWETPIYQPYSSTSYTIDYDTAASYLWDEPKQRRTKLGNSLD